MGNNDKDDKTLTWYEKGTPKRGKWGTRGTVEYNWGTSCTCIIDLTQGRTGPAVNRSMTGAPL